MKKLRAAPLLPKSKKKLTKKKLTKKKLPKKKMKMRARQTTKKIQKKKTAAATQPRKACPPSGPAASTAADAVEKRKMKTDRTTSFIQTKDR